MTTYYYRDARPRVARYAEDSTENLESRQFGGFNPSNSAAISSHVKVSVIGNITRDIPTIPIGSRP